MSVRTGWGVGANFLDGVLCQPTVYNLYNPVEDEWYNKRKMKPGDRMFITFFSYIVIFFIIARLVSLTGSISWMPMIKTTTKHDAILAIIFAFIVTVLTLN